MSKLASVILTVCTAFNPTDRYILSTFWPLLYLQNAQLSVRLIGTLSHPPALSYTYSIDSFQSDLLVHYVNLPAIVILTVCTAFSLTDPYIMSTSRPLLYLQYVQLSVRLTRKLCQPPGNFYTYSMYSFQSY